MGSNVQYASFEDFKKVIGNSASFKLSSLFDFFENDVPEITRLTTYQVPDVKRL